MKTRILVSALLAAALSGLTVNACDLTIRVACPNDRTAAGIEICVDGVGCVTTDSLGIANIHLPTAGASFNVCVTKATLPSGATLKDNCKTVVCNSGGDPVFVEFELDGDFCGTPPPQGDCWLTGGGTVGKVKGTPRFSYGGVVYPGCSPKAADGGNWNVIDHLSGLHFQGQHIIVDGCSGVSTKSPKVNVNIIDFHGEGIISGIGGNPEATAAVTFVGRAIDNLEPGAHNDQLFIQVSNGGVLLHIGNSAADPATISTGNLQIHTSSCSK